ncbi:exosome complex protein Rrp42 [Candidatus Woesearchaeota archaeon]|nr:exosome complex protein Rrp42 [Candidatus Woesearchaeota archaeon]
MMNQGVKDHILQALNKGIRLDGRKKDEFRPIEIKIGVVATAEGSAMVTCGDTQVVAGVKMDVAKPYPDSQEDGVMMFSSEMLPLSNPQFEPGPPKIESIEVARVIDRGIREGKAMDTKKLCITPGELVWNVMVDVLPINYDGNLIDIGGVASLTALYNARMPKLENDKVVPGSKTGEKIPLNAMPLPVTIGKIGDNLIVDPNDAEYQSLDARLTIAVLEDGTLCAMQKGGNASLTVKDLNEMIDLAVQKSQELRGLIKKALGMA